MKLAMYFCLDGFLNEVFVLISNIRILVWSLKLASSQ